jgi:hypothetical protein
MLGFQKNQGLRIDHILLSEALAERCTVAGISREVAQAGAAVGPRTGDRRTGRLMNTRQEELPHSLLALYPAALHFPAEQLAALCQQTALLGPCQPVRSYSPSGRTAWDSR